MDNGMTDTKVIHHNTLALVGMFATIIIGLAGGFAWLDGRFEKLSDELSLMDAQLAAHSITINHVQQKMLDYDSFHREPRYTAKMAEPYHNVLNERISHNNERIQHHEEECEKKWAEIRDSLKSINRKIDTINSHGHAVKK